MCECVKRELQLENDKPWKNDTTKQLCSGQTDCTMVLTLAHFKNTPYPACIPAKAVWGKRLPVIGGLWWIRAGHRAGPGRETEGEVGALSRTISL